MPRPLYLAQIGIGIAAIVWGRWACHYRQYRRPMYDRQLAHFLRVWFTRLPWGPARGVLTVAVIGVEPWYWGLVHDPRSYLIQAVNATAALTATALLITTIAVRRVFSHEWVVPTYEAMLELVGDKYEGRPSSRVHLTRQWQWHRKGIWLSFPLSLRLKETHREDIRTTAEEVLGLRDVDYQWNVVGGYSHLMFRPAQVVPKLAPFRNPDIRRAIETGLTELPTAPVLALGRGDVPIAIDLDTESPHILISAGTIGGKSVTVRALVSQLLWADPEAIGVIADKKEHSQRGLAAVPGVAYAREDEEINNALVAVWEEVQRRNRICRDIPLGEDLPTFPRIVLGLEEMNVTIKTLNAWWRRTNGVRAGQAPGIYALDNILCMGRAVRTNVILDGQSVNNRTTGGDAGAVNIAVRILAEYDENTWNRLAHRAEYIPPVSHKTQPGWCVIVHGREVQEGQRILMTDEQAHRWLTSVTNGERTKNLQAMRLELSPAPAPGQGAAGDSSSPAKFSDHGTRVPSTQAMDSESVLAGTDGDVDYVTLREVAVDTGDGAVPLKFSSLKRASTRPGFPPVAITHGGNGGNEYSRVRLVEWAATRRGNPVVYVLRPPRSGSVKIGYTINLRQRLDSLSLHPKTVVKRIPCDSRLAAQRLEAELHERFDAYRDEEDREWFVIRGELAEWLGAREEVAV